MDELPGLLTPMLETQMELLAPDFGLLGVGTLGNKLTEDLSPPRSHVSDLLPFKHFKMFLWLQI